MSKNSINYKITKYLDKYKKSNNSLYLYKVSEHSHNKITQSGGNMIIFEKHSKEESNIAKIYEIITHLVSNKKRQEQPYFVILIGSPGVGKSTARKVAMTKILGTDDQSKCEELYKSFVDINIDEITYKYKQQNNTGKERFGEIIKSLKNKLFDHYYNCKESKITENTDTKPVLDKLYKQSETIYFDIRNKINPIWDIILYTAQYLRLNVFFEITGQNYNTLQKLVDKTLEYKKDNKIDYKIIIMYPTISVECMHGKLIFDRAKNEGRLPNILNVMNSKQQIEDSYKKLIENYLNTEKGQFISVYKYELNNFDNNQKNDYNFKYKL